MVSRYLMLFGACYVSYVALKVLEISRSRTQLAEALKYADWSLVRQKKQFDALSTHMDEIRKARHDLRQHLTLVQSYLDQGDKTGLTEYINAYKNRLPTDVIEYFCTNSVVNAIISYYAVQARDAEIEFITKISYPNDCPISGTDITVLLGNLLENAVEACKREMSGKKFIKLRIKQRGQFTLLILLDNTCITPVLFEGETPLSSKRDGIREKGIGVTSIREIATRYNGSAQFEQKENIFYTSVRLMLSQE